MNYKELKEYADKYNRKEIIINEHDIEPLYDISLVEGKRLSKIYNADIDIVLIALALMDSKLPEAVRLKKPKEHVEMSLKAAKQILDEVYDLDDEKRKNILKCIEEHHGSSKYYSIESEVVANADCCKFLSPKGIMTYASILARRLNDFEKEWEKLEFKMDEKIKYVSLEKEELMPIYDNFKKYLISCRKK